jgi:hypothetical protein
MKLKDLISLTRKPVNSALNRAAGPQFGIKLINVDNVQNIGGIQIEWTDNLYDHLELSLEPYPVLKVYWFVGETLELPLA